MGSSSRGPTPSADDTWELVFRLSWMMREHFLSTARVFDLSPPQAGALQQLDPDTPVPMGELAVALHCDASTVTGLVDRLESRGLVERKASPRDRRVKALALTEEGRQVRDRFRERMSEAPGRMAALSPEDRRALHDILSRALASVRPPDPGGIRHDESEHAPSRRP
ncbi:MAG TPA: MarR family transcriptional regulator [Actinomycetota bacterium]